MARRTLDDEESLEALASGDLDFDQLMSQSGVRRLDKASAAKKRPTKPAQQKAQPQKAQPQKAPPTRAAPVPGRPRSGVEERAQAFEARTRQLEETLGTERSERKAERAHTAELESALSTAVAERDEARRKLGVASARLDEQRDRPTLGELLAERGLVGVDAQGAAVRALVDAHRWEELAELLEVVDPEGARAVVAAHVVLHCGRADCPPPPHTGRVPVAEERCDICGGLGQAGLLRSISDTCMLAGVTKIGLVGGPPGQLRILVDGLDRRLSLLRGDAASSAQVVVYWNVPGDGVTVDGGLAALAAALKDAL